MPAIPQNLSISKRQKAWRKWTRGLAMGLASLALSGCAGCSSPTSSSSCAPTINDKVVSTNKNKQLTDSLSRLAKSSGKGAVFGTLVGESKSVAEGLLKVASNAAGERYLVTHTETPLTGATILIFDAQRSSTLPETTLTTDSTGNFSALLKDGKYLGFAVHLDLETFKLVTAAIPFIQPLRDSVVKMDTAVAVEDLTAPTVTGVYDAVVPDANGIFYVGPIASSQARLTVSFSEPMQRESARNFWVGKLDTANQGVALRDTLPATAITKVWSGDSKQLTIGIERLETGSRYGLILPSSLKDLAKNPLEREYRASFKAVSAEQLAAEGFVLTSTFPIDHETLKPGQNPVLTFNRPAQVTSALQSLSLTPAVEGYWEAAGTKITFIHKQPFAVGSSFKISIPDTLVDLQGKALGSASQLTFTIKDYDGAVKDKTGKELLVAKQMDEFFNAYLQGDVGRLAGILSSNFRLEAQSQILSSGQFLDRLRREAGEKLRLNSGFNAPVYKTTAAACSTKVSLWKVAAKGGGDTLWVQARSGAGILPKVYRKDTEITSGIVWGKGGSLFTLEGKEFTYDLSEGDASAITTNSDAGFLGAMLKQGTTVVTEPVKDTVKETFTIDGGIEVTEPTAKVAVKLLTITRHGRLNWSTDLACGNAVSLDTAYRILKFFLKTDGSRWLITNMVDEGNVQKQLFDAVVKASDFKVREVKPITLVSPINAADKIGDTKGQVTFKLRGLDMDSVGGYLVGLAEDPKFIGGRLAYGTLLFVRSQGRGVDQVFVLDSSAQPLSGATTVMREVAGLGLPGWERVAFKLSLPALQSTGAGIAGVFNWKAIAIADTSAAQFLARGFSSERFFGESDFGPNKGSFAVKTFPSAAEFTQLDKQVADVSSSATKNSFADHDLDGFPDNMEANYKTLPDDKNSFPNFWIDSDHDQLADFLENDLDSTGVLAQTPATVSQRQSEINALIKMGIAWSDGDNDGWPDEVENLLGYNARDPESHPPTRAKPTPPVGTFSGLVKLGDLAYPLKFKVKNEEIGITVSYTAYLRDTLVDTVRGLVNETLGEFQFPVRLSDRGPDSGRSLLLRGNYDVNRALLTGGVTRIISVARTSTAFGSGLFVGQYAASGRGDEVSSYLNLSTTNSSPATPVTTTAQPGGNTPATTAVVPYRTAPTGIGIDAHLVISVASGKYFRTVLVDGFGDSLLTLDSVYSYPQGDGSYSFDGRQTVSDAKRFITRRYELHALLGKGEAAGSTFVVDGSFALGIDSCKTIDTKNNRCSEMTYRNIPGQFSMTVVQSDPIFKRVSNGVTGIWGGWEQQDQFGTGLTAAPTPSPDTTANNGGSGTPVVTAPPQSFSKPLSGGIASFASALTRAGVSPGDFFYAALGTRVLRVTYDSSHVLDGTFPYCGNVVLKPTLISLLDGASASEKDAFRRDSAWLASGSYAALVIEDDATAGEPALIAKAKDALGFTRNSVFIVELRSVDGGTVIGNKCLDGGVLPPPNPDLSALPQSPTGTTYFQGDLTVAQSALSASTQLVTLLKADGTAQSSVTLNKSSVRKDTGTGVIRAVAADDPSQAFILLAPTGSSNQVISVAGKPAVMADL